jgi:hypothetical protein
MTKPELTVRDVIEVVHAATGGAWEIRCYRRPLRDDDPDCGAIFTWTGTLHHPETGDKAAEFTVPDHYPDPYVVWT